MEKKYCPFCKCEQEVYPRGTLAVQLVDESLIVEYQCSKCGRKFREILKKLNNYYVLKDNSVIQIVISHLIFSIMIFTRKLIILKLQNL